MNFEAAMQGAEDIKKGPWYEEEDELLTTFVALLGDRRWDSIAKASGLRRSGKSCRLRWKNYLRPNLKCSKITADEESVILQLHAQLGNKWSRIAQSLPGRTDNEIKNYWRTHLKKKALSADQERGTRNIMDNASPDCCTQSINTNGKECNSSEHIQIIEDAIETSWDNAVGPSDFTSSSHETQLSDWISELSNDQSLEPLRDYNCVESSLCSLGWITGQNCDTNLWDFSFSLWDMV